jgi:predicted KAP-like P-loop ATPase
VGPVLERLPDYAEQIPIGHIGSVIQAFFAVGDRLMVAQDEDPGFFNRGNDARMVITIEKLLPRLDKPQRYRALKKAIDDGQAVSLIVDYVLELGKEQGDLGRTPLPDQAQTVTAAHLAELKRLAVSKIREVARLPVLAPGSLLQRPKLAQNLYRWSDWGEEGEIENWFVKLSNEITDDSQLKDDKLYILQQFVEAYPEWRKV